MKKVHCLLLSFLCLCSASFAQIDVPLFGRIQWISGYAKEISGENIGYFSAYPDYATTALLTRSTDGNKVIEWETAPVPKNAKGPYVYFSWVAAHSSGTSKGDRHFDLFLDGQKLLTFTTVPANRQPVWTFAAADSSRLVFQQTKRDASEDAHGLAFLRLPLSKLKPGQPVRLKVVGQAQGSNDWYMTFKFLFEEKVDVTPLPFLLKDGRQSLALTALHFGADQPLQVTINGKETYSFVARNGMNNFDLPVAAAQQPDSIQVLVKAGKRVLTNRYFPIGPVVHRNIYFIHHSHTDIGYSHLQPEVLRIHNNNINEALRMIAATQNLPAEARFKWNIESLWVVENYLQQATPEQKKAFIAAVKAGSICLSGLYANILTGMSGPEEVFHYTDYAERLRRQYGFGINSAMISDIPGYAWSTVTGLAKGGIRYFSSGPNFLGETHPYLGDRVGTFVKTWADKPVWWVSPSGEEKILFWTAGKGYSSWHGTAAGGIFDKGQKKIAAYMNELAAKNYPYDMVQWRYNIVADNGPLDTTISRFVAQWNEKYASPKIILGTTTALFEAFEKKYGSSLPVVRGDMTPYWEDGAFSTAHEEGLNRSNSMRLQQLATLYAVLNPAAYNEAAFYEAWKNLLLFHEHTWGAHNSTSEPDVPFVTEQWAIKKDFMLLADSQINRLEGALLQPLTDAQSNQVVVVNTTSWPRSGPVFLTAATTAQVATGLNGKSYPLQKLSDGRFVFWAENVPALGTALYTLAKEKTGSTAGNFGFTDSSVSNSFVTVQWDQKGSIVRLADADGYNYAGSFGNQGLNSYWYVPGLDPSKAETNSAVKAAVVEKGPVAVTVALTSNAPGGNGLERRITLYAGSDEVMLENRLDKKAVREKEAVHFGFPFAPALRTTTLDAGYGSMRFLADQLPGSNYDFVYGRRWLNASTTGKGLQWLFVEAPLLEPGAMIDERRTINAAHKEWKTAGEPTATWFSYGMNNYWHTNYKADQDGISRFRYCLKPSNGASQGQLERTAAEFTAPLVAIPVREGVQPAAPLFALTNGKVVVTTVTPLGGKRFLVRLFNPEASAQQTGFHWKAIKPAQVKVLREEKTINGNEPITLQGMAVVEIEVLQE